MQIKFKLSEKTNAHLQPDGKHYLVNNETGSLLLTLDELRELKNVMQKAEQSRGIK